MQKKTKAPLTFKDNFWSKQRVEKGMTIREIAELLGKSLSQVGMYFSGQMLPCETDARALCELFDVEFNVGQLEFQHAHRAWKADHNLTLVHSAKSAPATPVQPVVAPEVKQGKPEFNKDSVLELIYGKVDRSVYTLIEDLLDSI